MFQHQHLADSQLIQLLKVIQVVVEAFQVVEVAEAHLPEVEVVVDQVHQLCKMQVHQL
jgi:hypothetical protein